MKVYLVLESVSDFEDPTWIGGVFSSEEKAMEVAFKHYLNPVTDVYELTLDEEQ